MGFYCGCDDSDVGVVYTDTARWNDRKTIKCAECRCELAPGHLVRTTVMSEWWDEPFEDMDDVTLQEVLDSDETYYIHECERCADLGDAFLDTGMCWNIGEMWGSYRQWLEDRGIANMTRPGRL